MDVVETGAVATIKMEWMVRVTALGKQKPLSGDGSWCVDWREARGI